MSLKKGRPASRLTSDELANEAARCGIGSAVVAVSVDDDPRPLPRNISLAVSTKRSYHQLVPKDRLHLIPELVRVFIARQELADRYLFTSTLKQTGCYCLSGLGDCSTRYRLQLVVRKRLIGYCFVLLNRLNHIVFAQIFF